jgi:conjugal transfer pilus assembly protein TraW
MAGETADWMSLVPNALPVGEMGGKNGTCPTSESLEGIKTIVFISLGMPEESLRSLIEQGEDRPEVMFVLRGWTPSTGIKDIFQAIRGLIREDRSVNIVINPILFRGYGIQSVPVILQKSQDNRWYRVRGEISLAGAKQLIAEKKGGRTAPQVGNLHPIEEPDILDIIENRMKTYDWEGSIRHAKDRMLQSISTEIYIPKARESQTVWVDPSIRAGKEISLSDGRPVVARGTPVNPLDHVQLQKRYIFFDPSDSHQIDIVKRWIHQYPDSMLISTRTGLGALEGRQVFLANKLLIDRFHITALPTIVEQAGKHLKLRIEKCDD